VAALVAADGADSGDPGQTLGTFGIRWVLLPGPENPLLEQRLDAASGLVPLSSGSAYDLWQVADTVSRVRVIAPDGTVTAVASQGEGVSGVAAPASGGTLVLAEPYGGWTATLNGTALRPLPNPVDGWAQGFTLPKGGGTLAISRDNLARTLSLALELAALLVIVVLAIPGRREDPVEEAEAIAAVRAAQQERRVDRAAKTRELTRSAAVRAMESGVARRAVPGIVSGLPSGSAPRAAGSRALRASGALGAARALRSVRVRRGKQAEQTSAGPRAPLALPPATSATYASDLLAELAPELPTPVRPPFEPPALAEPAFEQSLPSDLTSIDPPRSLLTRTGDQPAASYDRPPWEPATPTTPATPDTPTLDTPIPDTLASDMPAIHAVPERPARYERGAHRGGRHGKPRGRRKGRDGEK
jgi:hypothetical protein